MYNRKQYVEFDNVYSRLQDVVCGVPQGSILGPKLFILSINDICNVSDILRFVLFADDTNIFCSHNDINTLYRQVNNELSKLYTWFAINKLSLNVDKTNYMLFTNRSVESILDVNINNVTIDRVYIAKFLGVFIDHKLSWKEHISKLCSKLSKCVALIYKASHVLSSNALYILYCTLFLPYLTYCVEV